MRLIFFLFAAVAVMTWYAWAIRPSKREQSNLLFGIAAIIGTLLALGLLRLV